MFNDRYGLTQAVLDGRKTQTRRVIKEQCPYTDYELGFPVFEDPDWAKSPLFGAFCWIDRKTREHLGWIKPSFKEEEVVAVAQKYEDILSTPLELRAGVGWKNKMFVSADLMPHKIRITDVRLERLQDISDEDCVKEGIFQDSGDDTFPPSIFYDFAGNDEGGFDTPREAFAILIDKVSGKGTWDSNPYVWVYDFELVK